MMWRVTADESYLFIGGYGDIIDQVCFGGDRVGLGGSSHFLPYCIDNGSLDWAVRVVGGIDSISVTCLGAVYILVDSVVAGMAASHRVVYICMVVS
jgi:hypothetical protein